MHSETSVHSESEGGSRGWLSYQDQVEDDGGRHIGWVGREGGKGLIMR